MTTLVFDIETIPDTESGKRLYGLDGLSDKQIAELMMFNKRRQDTGGSSDFLRHHLHRVVAISVIMANADKLNVWSIGNTNASEQEIVQRFFEGIDKYTPVLVSWNGRGFDLPVLHYRALLHGVQAPRYWETGDDDQSFRWNNYLNRFHQRHTDLMDVLSGYEYRSIASLHEIATMLGLPGKLGMDGSQVWDYYLRGDIEAIRNYCETDVLNTYLIYLRYQFMRGVLTPKSYERECDRVRELLRTSDRPHFQEFLTAWSKE
ncbi:MAG: 3'-5' exonuclease [Gammaproteobacteria bacterium]|nr:3'-5' exonuclease [Gammaproteobacteria bacterium]